MECTVVLNPVCKSSYLYQISSDHNKLTDRYHMTISKKLKLALKNTITDKTLTYTSETWTLTKRGRKQLNIFERKVYRRILGPVYDNEKEK